MRRYPERAKRLSGLCCFGIDGGGTRSRLALIDRGGKILASSEGGSSNIYSVSKEEVFENLFRLINSALESAGLHKTDIGAGCLGSAGLGREGEAKLFRNYFNSILGPEVPVKLCTDGEILLCGGLGDLEGYGLIAGTGSLALGRARDGRLVRAGGHGYMLGDEGSAAWIGRTAIARILRSLEDRDLPTNMLKAVLEAACLKQEGDLVKYVHHDADKPAIAAHAPVVTAAARQGDPLALDILNTGARELALLVKSVRSRSPWIERQVLVLAGGVMEHDEILTGKLKELLSGEYPDISVGFPRGTALEGACMLAADLLKGICKN